MGLRLNTTGRCRDEQTLFGSCELMAAADPLPGERPCNSPTHDAITYRGFSGHTDARGPCVWMVVSPTMTHRCNSHSHTARRA